MTDIARTIIRYHRRRKHILGLFVIIIMTTSFRPIIQGLSLGEENYVMTQWMLSSIEIIGVLFTIYFASTIYQQHKESQILSLLMSKRQSPSAYILGIIGGIMSIMIIYSIIGAIITSFLTNQGTLIGLYQGIWWIIIFATMATISLLLSLIASPYIVIMTSSIIYGVTYSLNFLLFITQKSSESIHTIISTIALILPRFDLLASGWGSTPRRWAIGTHSIYIVVLLYLTIISFSLSLPGRSSPASIHDSRKKE